MVKKITKTHEEWKEQLTPEQFEICINKGTRHHHFQGNITTVKKKESTHVSVAVNRYSIQTQSLTLAQAGQAFGIPCLKKKLNIFQINL